jgi:hypothetical protein
MVDYGGTDKWSLTVVIEGLSPSQRDTLTDAIEAGDDGTITVDFGTRNYIGYLKPGSLGWRENQSLATVRFMLVGATVV